MLVGFGKVAFSLTGCSFFSLFVSGLYKEVSGLYRGGVRTMEGWVDSLWSQEVSGLYKEVLGQVLGLYKEEYRIYTEVSTL